MECSQSTLDALEFDKVKVCILERAVSAPGREVLKFLGASDDPEEIQSGLRLVLEGIDLISFGDPISVPRIPDIRRSLQASRAPGSILGIANLLEAGSIIASSGRLFAFFSARRDKYPRLFDLLSRLHPHPELLQVLQAALDPATESVRDSASPTLKRLRREISRLRSEIRDRVETCLSNLPDRVTQERLVTIRAGRFVIPVKERQRGRVEGIVHDQSASGATLFVEPIETVEPNNRLRQLELSERQEVERVLQELTARVSAVAPELIRNVEILGEFDAIYAKASFSRDLRATEPVFNDRGRILLRDARHPLLFNRLKAEGRAEALVPLRLTLGDEAFWTLILTGPNAGGKTVAMKTVGLLALLAQSGLPIPAGPQSELPIFSSIFADIGDSQSVENDLSSFSSHVTKVVEICQKADSRALVLLDEVGSSTEPDQGSALSTALLKELARRGCRTIATTHHAALKVLAHDSEGMQNGSMAFDTGTLRPTFHLRLGVPGSSYAFEIARRLGLPNEIVDAAVEIAGSDIGRTESLIAGLDEACERAREHLERAEADRKKLDVLIKDYETQMGALDRERRTLKRTAQEEAERILKEANALIERTVRELRQRQADKTSIRSAHESIQRAKASLGRELAEARRTGMLHTLNVGDRVWIPSLERAGIVLSNDRGGERVRVEVGKLKMELSLTELEAPRSVPEPKTRLGPDRYTGEEAVSLEVDLRGMTFDEASDVVEKYLDELQLAGVGRATIIHGKGTGVLRKKVGDLLARHPLVKSQRLGGAREGGSGVTIVELDTDV